MTTEEKCAAARFQMLVALVKRRGFVMKKSKDCFAIINYPRGGPGTEYRCLNEANVYRALTLMSQLERRL
jgi:hypothetical protein